MTSAKEYVFLLLVVDLGNLIFMGGDSITFRRASPKFLSVAVSAASRFSSDLVNDAVACIKQGRM